MIKLALFLLCFLVSCDPPLNTENETTAKDSQGADQTDHEALGQEVARTQLDDALKGRGQPFTWDTLIRTASTAIAVAEPIIFDAFGKEQTLRERPYEVYLLDGYWYIAGTIPREAEGGGFEIILSAKDAQIIRFTHYK